MHRVGGGALVGLALALVVPVACSSKSPAPAKRPSLLTRPSGATLTYPSPARWLYHPRKEARLLAKLSVGKKTTLYAGSVASVGSSAARQ